MDRDPYDLDGTEFARVCKSAWGNVDADEYPDDLVHPLRVSPAIADVSDALESFESNLLQTRRPQGEMADDVYSRFDEGQVLRTEIVVRFVLEHIKANRHLLD